MKIDKLISFIKKNFRQKRIFLNEPIINKIDEKSVNKTIKSTFVSSAGKATKLFEQKVASITGSKYAIAVNSGTSALFLSLIAAGVKKNEEVFVPSMSYVASANAILYNGSIPHFVEVKKENIGINFKKLENYVNKNFSVKKNKLINNKNGNIVKALILVHVFGQPADPEVAKKFCKKYKLKLIEDAAGAVGSYYKKKHLGTFGDAGIISFNGNKTITTGAGGIVLTNNKSISDLVYNLSTVNKTNDKLDFNFRQIGYNSRMPSLNAALGLSQISKLGKILSSKKNIAKKYETFFNENFNNELIFLKKQKNTKPNFWLNAIFLKNSNLKKRKQLLIDLSKNNIFCRPIWKPLHLLPHFKKYQKMNLSTTNLIHKSVINLPSSPIL